MDKAQLAYMSWLTSVNSSLGRYIGRLMNEATGSSTTTYVVSLAEVERELGDELLQLARVLLDKATGSAQPDDDRPAT